jgi:DNA-binding NarL/FixJ family response regulator
MTNLSAAPHPDSSNRMETLRLLLVDDHEVVRLGMRALLNRHPTFDVVAEAATEEDAVQQAIALQPDIVLMDIRLADGSGIDACERIVSRLPETKVIMLTSYAEDELLFAAIRAGAAGYVLKQVDSRDLVKAIESAAQGEATLDPSLTQKVFNEVRRSIANEESQVFASLTAQEMQVLAQIAEGKTNKNIAKALFLSEGTVRNYVSSVLSKLNVANRAEAAAFAIKHHLQDHLPD